MSARIYRPAPTPMQSGLGKSRDWVLEFEPTAPRQIEPLMGYTSTTDTRTQVRLRFATLEEAEAFARREGIAYTIQPAHDRTPKRTVYSDNFRSDRLTPWTH